VITERALNTLAAAVTDWSEDKSKREALVQLGRSVLIKWLLSRALDDSNKLEQAEAEHALLNLLADGELVCVWILLSPLLQVALAELWPVASRHLPQAAAIV